MKAGLKPRAELELDGLALDPYCKLYLPLWKLDGDSFMSKDAYGHLCTNHGSIWILQGRSFDGVDDYVDCGSPPSLYQTPNNQWTIMAWVKPSELTGLRNIVRKNASGNGYYLRNNAGSIQSLLHWSDGTYTPRLGGTFSLGIWQHVAIVYDGNVRKHFKDGVEVGSWTENKTLSFETTAFVAIGRNSTGDSEYWNGLIDEVRIYNRALTSEEIKAHFLGARVPKVRQL